MGKSVFADENLLSILTSLSGKQGFVPGLIIGQPSPKKDFVVHLTVTPILKDDPSSNNDHIQELEHIEDSWLKIHMRNVTRSLPGGMYVLGIFIVGPKDIFNEKQALQKVRSLISNLHTSTKSNSYLFGNNNPANKLVLHFCSKSKKYQCKSFDVQNMNLSMNPVTWKFVRNPTLWYSIDCNYAVTSSLPYFCLNNKNTPLKKVLKDILAVYKSGIDECIITLNGVIQNSDCNTLDDINNLVTNNLNENGNENVDLHEENKSLVNFKALLFKVPQHSNSDSVSKIETIKTEGGKLKFKGVLASKTFLHTSATIDEAVNAIKEDLIRSLAARLELHCDSLEDDSVYDKSVLHTPPRRVLVEHISSGILFSDYMFPDDTTEDIAASFKENLGIEVLPESIIELEPKGKVKEATNIETEVLQKPNSQVNLLLIGLIGAAIVLILSIVAHFLM